MRAPYQSDELPSIRLLPDAVDGEALEVSGWICRFDEMDAESEQFHILGMEDALKRFMSTNPIVLLNHKRSEVPVGKVTSIEMRPGIGVLGKALIPKALSGKAGEVYEAVKNGLLRGWSLGGIWDRMDVGGQTRLFARRIVELSLATAPTSESAVMVGGPSVVQVKALGDGTYVPVAQYADYAAAHALMPRLELAELTLDVASMIHASR